MLTPKLPTPKEFDKKVNVSYAMMAYIGGAGFFIGFGICAFWFALAEVGGVRADMDKEDKALKAQIENVNNRMDRKIKNHNSDRDAHK